jgi:hypothetical protein
VGKRTYLNGNLPIVDGLPSPATIAKLGRDATLQGAIRLGVDSTTLATLVAAINPAVSDQAWLPDLTAFLASSVRQYLALAAKDVQGADSPAKLAYATVADLAAKYQAHVDEYHASNKAERRQTASVLRLLTACYGGLPADRFTTVQLLSPRLPMEWEGEAPAEPVAACGSAGASPWGDAKLDLACESHRVVLFTEIGRSRRWVFLVFSPRRGHNKSAQGNALGTEAT